MTLLFETLKKTRRAAKLGSRPLPGRGARLARRRMGAVFAVCAALVLVGYAASFAQKSARELVNEGVRIYKNAKKNGSIRGLVKAKSNYFFRAQQLDPKNKRARRYIGEVDKEIFRLRKKHKEAKQRALARARQVKSKGDFYDSIVAYRRLLELDPKNREALFYLRGNEEKTKRYTRRYADRGIYLAEKGRYDEGLEFLDKIRVVDPENQKANRYRAKKSAEIIRQAERAYREARVAEAQSHLNLALRFDANENALRFKRKMAERRLSKKLLKDAKTQIAASKYLKARETLLKYRKLNPGGNAARKMLYKVEARIRELARESIDRGIKLYQAGRLDKAIKVFNKALMYDPTSRTALEYKRRAEIKLKALQNI